MSRKRLSDCKTQCQYILLASAERYCFVSALIHGHKTADDLAAKKRALGARQRCGSASHTSGTSGFRDLTWLTVYYFVFRIFSAFPTTREYRTSNSDLSFVL